ncbi:MAG: hypothetical protein IT367_12700, partial [Candidatus Hydrogenedentes bacterium]|nr:hypothetical protein [Candidatus Hydrogenedentota bacterium]
MRTFIYSIVLLCFSGCVTGGTPRGIDAALRSGPDAFLAKAAVGPQDDGTYVVPTTQRIAPAGEQVLFPGRPVGLAFSPDGSVLAIKGRQDIVLVDTASKTIW